MRSILTVIALVVLTGSIQAQPGSAGVFKVPAEAGDFEFSDINVITKILPELHGNVTNKTDRDWLMATFEIYFLNDKGKQVYTPYGSNPIFVVGPIKRGETKSISSEGNNVTLEIDRNTKIARFGIKFLKGIPLVTYDVALIKPVPVEDMKFEDDAIKIDWAFSYKALIFVMTNKTDAPIKIDWNQVSIVDVTGTAQKVMHEGVKFISRNDSQPPTIIPPTAKIQDIIYPSANVYYASGSYGGWRETPMFPDSEEAFLLKGKTFSAFIPLEINGAVKNYTFTFRIEDVRFKSVERSMQPAADKAPAVSVKPAADEVPAVSVELKPEITYKERAKYTKTAREHLIEGVVLLNVMFTHDGKIEDINVINGLPDGLTESAIEAARKVRFKPAQKDGKPVSVRGKIEFKFSL